MNVGDRPYSFWNKNKSDRFFNLFFLKNLANANKMRGPDNSLFAIEGWQI